MCEVELVLWESGTGSENMKFDHTRAIIDNFYVFTVSKYFFVILCFFDIMNFLY